MKTVTITFAMDESGKTPRLDIKVNGEPWGGLMDVCELLCKAKHEIFIELTDEVASQFTIAPHLSEAHD